MTEPALLVLVAGPRLKGLGFPVPEKDPPGRPFEHLLYEAIEDRCEQGAHYEYNSLIRKIVSFAQSYEQWAFASKRQPFNDARS